MTTLRTSDACPEALTAGAGMFMADYAACLLGCGATCSRLEKNVQRMSHRWGMNTEMTIMPRHIQVAVTGADGCTSTYISSIGKASISYEKITLLSKLSWKVADRGIGVADAREILGRIKSVANANRWWVLVAVSSANASFCRLFGGDSAAMAVVFVATMAGYYLKQLMLGSGCDTRLTFAVCAFVSSVLAAAGFLFHIGSTPDVAIATSVLYLVPGIAFLNAFNDMIDGHYVCFFSRLMDAIVLTCCLSAGLCLGMAVMKVGMF